MIKSSGQSDPIVVHFAGTPYPSLSQPPVDLKEGIEYSIDLLCGPIFKDEESFNQHPSTADIKIMNHVSTEMEKGSFFANPTMLYLPQVAVETGSLNIPPGRTEIQFIVEYEQGKLETNIEIISPSAVSERMRGEIKGKR